MRSFGLRIMSSDEKTSQQRREEWTVRLSSPQIRSSMRSQPRSMNFWTPINSLLSVSPWLVSSETVGPRYSVNLNVSVDVFDAERSNALPLLMIGLSTSRSPARSAGRLWVRGQAAPRHRCLSLL